MESGDSWRWGAEENQERASFVSLHILTSERRKKILIQLLRYSQAWPICPICYLMYADGFPVFSLPSKCGFLSQFRAIFFLNIRCEWNETEKATGDKKVSTYSICSSVSFSSLLSSKFYRSIIPPFLSLKIIRRFLLFVPYIRAGIWKSNNHLRWRWCRWKKGLHNREAQREVLWKCDCKPNPV